MYTCKPGKETSLEDEIRLQQAIEDEAFWDSSRGDEYRELERKKEEAERRVEELEQELEDADY
jgi:hypothetical protein